MIWADNQYYNPVVERTRLRFADMAELGWLYLTNAPRNGSRAKDLELYAEYGRPFQPEEVRISHDLPAFGCGQLSHAVLPDASPVFIRPGRPDVRQALQAPFTAENQLWKSQAEAYSEFFVGVTRQRYAELFDTGWLWVMDICLRSSRQDSDELAERIVRSCMALRFISAAGTRVSRALGRSTVDSIFCLPVFIRPRVFPARVPATRQEAAFATVD